jgi:hypothetical protein
MKKQKKLTPEQIFQLKREQTEKQVMQCEQEVAEVLKKYHCTFDAQAILTVRGNQIVINVVPLKE